MMNRIEPLLGRTPAARRVLQSNRSTKIAVYLEDVPRQRIFMCELNDV